MFPVFVDGINVVIEGLGDLFSGTVDLQYVIFLELTPVGWVLVAILRFAHDANQNLQTKGENITVQQMH